MHQFLKNNLKVPEFSIDQNIYENTLAAKVYEEVLWLVDGNHYLNMSIYKRIGGSYFFKATGRYGDDLPLDEKRKAMALDTVDELYNVLLDEKKNHLDHAPRRATSKVNFHFEEELFGSRIPKTVKDARDICEAFIQTRRDIPKKIHGYRFYFNDIHASLQYEDRKGKGQFAEAWKGFKKTKVAAGMAIDNIAKKNHLSSLWDLCQLVQDDNTSTHQEFCSTTDLMNRMDALRADKVYAKLDDLPPLTPEQQKERELRSVFYQLSSLAGSGMSLKEILEADPRFDDDQIGFIMHHVDQEGAAGEEMIQSIAEVLRKNMKEIDEDES